MEAVTAATSITVEVFSSKRVAVLLPANWRCRKMVFGKHQARSGDLVNATSLSVSHLSGQRIEDPPSHALVYKWDFIPFAISFFLSFFF